MQKEEIVEEAFDIEPDLEIREETEIETLVFEETPEEEVSDEIFQIVEQQAAPVGGMS